VFFGVPSNSRESLSIPGNGYDTTHVLASHLRTEKKFRQCRAAPVCSDEALEAFQRKGTLESGVCAVEGVDVATADGNDRTRRCASNLGFRSLRGLDRCASCLYGLLVLIAARQSERT